MENSTMQFGVHYMLDGYGADANTLSDAEVLREILKSVPAALGMHTICEPVVVTVGPKNTKDSGGVSGFVMIAESHISFHTFPNRRFVSIDVYTCQNDLNTESLTEQFSQLFGLSDTEVTVVPRGTRYPIHDVTQ